MTFLREEAQKLYQDFYQEEVNQITDKIKKLAEQGKDELILEEIPSEHVIRLIDGLGFDTDETKDFLKIWW